MKNDTLDLELVFPIRDKPSALFMGLKADCLFRAGIISECENRWVQSRISAVMDSGRKEAA